ncbi:helix-turn-helix transcriptional regulator [Brevibacillus laterosporus]|uniref:helix-turn-helix transcriptional regulator n=1 Tax=Brevibacillus laterosporus TaxID=1465 RepID=UPI002653CAE4|nr:AraC family transcriptional regulator [Brevibacillus laterosporus]MDN9008800.1 AraC family transcriptional regulator [Brevibacillus laterosporus]MDO0940907.1 AraC family transcriptional regulator [Brevibacillus laterosporus]
MINVDGQEFSLKAGGIVVINSNSIHSFEVFLKPGQEMFTILLPYKGFLENVPNFNRYHIECNNLLTDSKYKNNDYQVIEKLILEIYHYSFNNSELDYLMLHSLAYKLLHEILDKYGHFYPHKNHLKPFFSQDPKEILDVIQYIQIHYANIQRIQDVAIKYNFSQGYFSRYFKKYVGMSPKKYLAVIRLQHAENLLRNTKVPISTIAATCGFQTDKAFYQLFKKYHDKTPFEYRNEMLFNNHSFIRSKS